MNEKLVINANLLRKEPEFGTRVCVVEKRQKQSPTTNLNV